MAFTLQNLTTPEGIRYVIDVTGKTSSFYNHPENAAKLQQVAIAAIARNPAIAGTPVRILPNFPNAKYDYQKNEILLGIVNPAALAHEIEHAHNLSQTGMYQKLIGIAQGVSQLNNTVAMPAVLALRVFLKDPQKRDDVLKTLAAISAAAAAPGLVEESSASIQALKNNPDRAEALKTLMPALLAHFAKNMSPSVIYQLGRE